MKKPYCNKPGAVWGKPATVLVKRAILVYLRN